MDPQKGNKRINRNGKLSKFNGKKWITLCSEDECETRAREGGVCIKHGSQTPKCSVKDCKNVMVNNNVCMKHGAARRICYMKDCTKQVQNNNVCLKHGARIPKCLIKNGCTVNQRKLCGKKECIICLEKSFASHPRSKFWNDGNISKPIELSKGMGEKYLFDCDVCNHVFKSSLNKVVSSNQWCNFCANRKLCNDADCTTCFDKSFASQPRSKFWSTKNTLLPREVFKSSKKFLFDCDVCTLTFSMSLNNITTNNTWCSCTVNKTETKLYNFLLDKGYDVQKQVKFDWCKNITHLPFDFVTGNIIIELDGEQHFTQVSNWESPEETLVRDNYKTNCAIENNYKIIRVLQESVWNDTDDWKTFITESINTLNTTPLFMLVSDKEKYKHHNQFKN